MTMWGFSMRCADAFVAMIIMRDIWHLLINYDAKCTFGVSRVVASVDTNINVHSLTEMTKVNRLICLADVDADAGNLNSDRPEV